MNRDAAAYLRGLPNVLSGFRLLLIPALTIAALAGNGRLVGLGVLVAAASDVLDGRLARRLGVAGNLGARLDALADSMLMLSASVWLFVLHPEMLAISSPIVVTAIVVWIASTAVAVARFGDLRHLRRISSKFAGGCLYAFALLTFFSGVYEPLLLTLAAGALIVSSVDALLITMTDTIARARKARSQSPHAENPLGTSTAAIASSPIMATPSGRK
jgi:phosphatidylglycerophosphate synthase